jgi:PAS domain S-box-containing protein
LVGSIKDYAIFSMDSEGRIETWNGGAELIQGYSAREIIGHSSSLFYVPEAIAAGHPHELLGQAATQGRVGEEGWRVRKDGSRFWADVVITALTDEQGHLTGFGEVTRDLTQRRTVDVEWRKRQEDLLRSEERFRLLVEGVQDYAIFMLDPDGVVTTWNSGAERIKGYKAAEVIGKHFSLFRTEEDIRSDACERELETAAQHGKLEEEGWRVRKDGSIFWANVVLTAIRSSSGDLLGFAKITRDLTERRLLDEERLRRARAEEAVRLRDEFLSIASHELKTPITSLQLDLFGMQRELGDSPTLGTKVARAVRNVDRLTTLVESLLNVSRLVHGKLELKPEAMDLSQAVVQVVDSMRGQVLKSGCDLTLSVPLPVPGVWDRLRIEQVVMNLLSNAIKYGAGGPVEVSVTKSDGLAILVVEDRGPGVPEVDLHRIFDRFERAASARHYGGLGLGLYVSQEIIRAHEGAIAACNRLGGGASFTVHLPVKTNWGES